MAISLKKDELPGDTEDGTICSACSPTIGGNNFGNAAVSGPDCVTGCEAPLSVGLQPSSRPSFRIHHCESIFHPFGGRQCGMLDCLGMPSSTLRVAFDRNRRWNSWDRSTVSSRRGASKKS